MRPPAQRLPVVALAVAVCLAGGAAARDSADPHRGVDDLAVCDAAVRDGGGSRESYDCYRAYVTETQDRDGAVARLEAQRRARPGEPWAAFTQGLLQRGPIEELQALFEEAAAGFRDDGRPADAALAGAELINELIRHGRHEEAEAVLARAQEDARASGDRVAELRLLVRESKLAQRNREWDRSWSRGREALTDPAFERLEIGYRLSVLYAIATTGVSLGRVEQALRYAEGAVELAEATGDKKQIADAASSLIWIAGSAVEFEVLTREEALERTRAAREAIERSGNRILRAIYLRDLVRVSEGAGRRESLDALERIARGTGHEPLLSSVLLHRADVLVQEDPARAGEAIELARRALEYAGSDLMLQSGYLSHIARFGMLLDDRDRAIEDALAAIDRVEAVRAALGAPELRARAVGRAAWIHYELADFLLDPQARRPGDVDRAFAVMERLRGRLLVEQPPGTPGATPPDASALDAEGLREWADLRRRISDLQLRLMSERDARARAELMELLEYEESREESFQRDWNLGLPRRSAEDLATLDEARAALAPDAALLYFVASRTSRSWVLVVTREGTEVHALPERERLATAVRIWVGLLAARDPLEEQVAERLGALLAPALADAVRDRARVYVVPDGPFHQLPFAALALEGERLGAAREVVSLPSATYWLEARGRAARRSARALVLADPEVGPGGAETAVRDVGLASASLGALPHARDEAQRVLEALDPSGTLRMGADASEAFLKAEDLSGYGVIHFAAHAVLNERLPGRSAVLLSAGNGEDGLLQARDIERLGLRDSVVVLAACQTAAGDHIRGEGVLSLARSFLAAGARTVVASRWPLRDDESAAFFAAFYASLGEGRTVAQALHDARRESRRDGLHAATWAGVVSIGDADARLVVDGGGRWGTVLALALGAALALLALRRLGRRRATSRPVSAG